MAERVIETADLSRIENNLAIVFNNLDILDGRVQQVSNNVNFVSDELSKLARDFHEYVEVAARQTERQLAETRLIKIRQELETKFGHYAEIRRTTTGVLQADDLGIVKKETITDVTEEMMITTPNYWLAPCLVALSAWINDKKDIADRALKEAIKRDDEKTSLLFALICRRADRKQACLKWARRYFENQDPENLDRKCIVMLDAYASGLLGADSEGVIADHIERWIVQLEEKPGFVEKQTQQWSEAINLKRQPLKDSEYTYLKKYSATWPVLEDIMEGANLHAIAFDYFENILNQEVSTINTKKQLDEILDSLVTDFDDEELPLRKEEKLNQFIVDFEGDKDRAEAAMSVEETAFETHKDFTQLLTDAAMKPESTNSSASTQKFSLSLCKEWVSEAYRDIIATNRSKIPEQIDIHLTTGDSTIFAGTTKDGENEGELVANYNNYIDKTKMETLAKLTLSGFQQFCLYGGGVIAALGIIMAITGNLIFGLVIAIVGAGLVISHFSAKKNLETQRENTEKQFEEMRKNGTQIIRATLAEVVDFRAEFAEKDAESTKVVELIDGMSPDQYVKRLTESTRRIKMNA
ncbi:hypothetical protein [Frisingicoccus sp.]|uniref:hypothetical protein n=1 Tax=Frisingicoccus sp. TaxID=1918627 RepID=UPI00399C2228